MSYITVQEAAKKWGISERLVRRYCAEGRIPDLAQYDGIWQIPEDAAKPLKIATVASDDCSCSKNSSVKKSRPLSSTTSAAPDI